MGSLCFQSIVSASLSLLCKSIAGIELVLSVGQSTYFKDGMNDFKGDLDDSGVEERCKGLGK